MGGAPVARQTGVWYTTRAEAGLEKVQVLVQRGVGDVSWSHHLGRWGCHGPSEDRGHGGVAMPIVLPCPARLLGSREILPQIYHVRYDEVVRHWWRSWRRKPSASQTRQRRPSCSWSMRSWRHPYYRCQSSPSSSLSIETSRVGFGVVLHQGDGVIVYFSRAAAPHH